MPSVVPRFFSPWAVIRMTRKATTTLLKGKSCALRKIPRLWRWGEIGLDYHYDLSERDVQKEVFSRQLSLARKLGLPVVLHTRDAWKDTLDILREEGSFPHGLLLHCFSGSAEIMKILSEKYDAYFAFGGAITFKNYARCGACSHGRRKQAAVRNRLPLSYARTVQGQGLPVPRL